MSDDKTPEIEPVAPHPRHRDKRHFQGWKRDLPDPRDKILKMPLMGRYFLASKVDLRKIDKMPRMEDQSYIGSCTANSATSALEYIAIKEKKPVVEMSRLFLYYATRVWVEGVPATEDAGAHIRDVMKTLFKFGVCHEETWPYDPNKFSKCPPPVAIAEAKRHSIYQYWRCPSLRAIKVSLLQGYPVVGGFSVPASIEDEETLKTGIVKYPKPDEEIIGGHAVLFVGYDDASKLLCFENSWGGLWGDKGYGYLPYDYVTNGLAEDFWTIRAAYGV